MASKNSAYSQTNQDHIFRPSPAEFPNCIWADRFKPIMVDEKVYNMEVKEIEKLKEEVGSMLIKIKERTTIEKLILIDTLQKLGISYHFEKQIDSLLQQIFLQNANSQEEPLQNDLYATALLFRLLRQHGFHISSGIFCQFLNSAGNFEESLNDIKGLLNLYEAAHVMTHEEIILEEALSFATTHLKCGGEAMSSSVAKQINHALEQPLHRGFERIEVRHYISIYEEDEGKNPLLLRLAKLDYRHLQILYRKELNELFSWHKHLETAAEVSYIRVRLVECYFWGLAMLFEPQYSSCRLLCAKTFVLISTINDIYDYGKLDELKLFRDALERWDAKEIDGLPDYMKPLYNDLLNFSESIKGELTKQGKSRLYALRKFEEEFKRYVRGSYAQSHWIMKKEMAAFEDYEKMGVATASYFLIGPTAFIFHESCTEDVFNWLATDPKISVAASVVGRFLNDVASYEREKQQMGQTGLEYYMKDYNVSLEETMKKFEDVAEDAWKDINKELLRPTEMPREILMPYLNLGRMSDVCYKNRQDGYTNPVLNMESNIVSVLLDLIIV